MRMIGYSTGALDPNDVRRALTLVRSAGTAAVELSALRTHELKPLLHSIPSLPLDGFTSISVHAPSSFTPGEEPEIAEELLSVLPRGWHVVLHPDTIHDHGLWTAFGDRLCIENMDRRKPGRTVEELRPVFEQLPRASFCFDIAHARQCDTSMVEAYRLLHAFRDRLAQVHVSELDAHSRHVRLTRAGVWACREVAELIPPSVPAIIEAPVRPHEIDAELASSMGALGREAVAARAA